MAIYPQFLDAYDNVTKRDKVNYFNLVNFTLFSTKITHFCPAPLNAVVPKMAPIRCHISI